MTDDARHYTVGLLPAPLEDSLRRLRRQLQGDELCRLRALHGLTWACVYNVARGRLRAVVDLLLEAREYDNRPFGCACADPEEPSP